jgi:aryl-alcohol dehydrogenase-like predicted oxidoreductase
MSEERKIQSLGAYTLLGRSGLRVSPLALGTMTFGTEWGWGSDVETARTIFHRYLEAGGNFVDTADGYTNGRSEEMLGKFMADAKNRDRIVLATKFSFTGSPGDRCGSQLAVFGNVRPDALTAAWRGRDNEAAIR